MWCAHFAFHLLSGVMSAVPVAQRVANDLGVVAIGAPAWSMVAMAPPADWLIALELLVLDAGLLLTLYVAWRIASSAEGARRRALARLVPWATFASALYVVGVWILFQPMQMRGMMMP